MRVITIARKPCSEPTVAANALKWGTGGLNIDGSRIYCGTEHMRGEVARRSTDLPGAVRTNAAAGMYAPEKGFVATDHPAGRWPANLILQHKPGCQQVGEKKVKGSPTSKTYHEAYEGESATGFLRGVSHPGNQHASPDGTETVAAWECEPGCPVAALDAQSGVVATGSWNRQTDGAHPFGNAKDTPYDNWKTVTEAPGGASRYFKQVGLDNTDPSD